MSGELNSDRRHFFGTAAMTIAAAQLGMVALGMHSPATGKEPTSLQSGQGRTPRSRH